MSKPAINDITGDKIKSKPASDAYRNNFEAVFGKKDKTNANAKAESKNTRS